MKKILTILLLALMTLTASAQRTIDKLDRGLIAIKTTSGVYVNWRIQSNEYFDVKYNLYRDGTKIAENLNVSNYNDAAGTTSSTYTVAAVVRGKEQTQCAAVKPWAQNYLEIIPKHDASLTSTYVPNDACCVDVDGDGVVEILMKYNNQEESYASYPKAGNNGEYTLFECLKLDGTVLWWVNCGPNMGDFQNNEQNIVGYDWDMDGKGEVIMRLCEGAQVHMADGTVYTLGADGKNGTTWTNYRQPKTGGVEWFTYYGNEYLFYCEGATGKPYQCIPYPCARLEPGETDLNKAWGDGYGHRANKFFFGAPYLDGRKPSIFLGRGIYTRHKFVALDVNPETHQLTERWRWYNNTNGPWKGQGYHNYAIADVDMDGRDEIIWGSMVIDDNGKGLSTTGLGHGDAQHHGDLDPYTWGLEGFFCNEEKPANNYRDLTTAKLYHRYAASGDDGRAIAGNFCNTIPGAMGFSAHEDAISCVTGKVESVLTKTGVGMNFRCYWDGDLCEETYNGGDNTVGTITKYGGVKSWQLTGSLTNNSTKATPSYMGDILGDWREEFVVRTPNNRIRIYSTTEPTQWRNYSLWYDHQYRNGMVWEPCGYNQPPHTSYFLGELEGITVAPPSLTMEGRKEIANGATISNNDEEIIMCETNDMTVSVVDGATPYIYIDNAPSWVQGYAPQETNMANDPSKITYKYYTHTLTGGAFAGDMRLVKQGEGTLVLPNVTQKYTGNTDIWNGTLSFDGTMEKSRVWLNRHTTLLSNGGDFKGGIEADYNATINVAGKDVKGSISVGTLTLNMGAKVILDVYSEDLTADNVNMSKLVINHHKDWKYGPAYLAPVIIINAHLNAGEQFLKGGKYLLGTLAEVEGNLSDIILEGLSGAKATLVQEDGKLYLDVQGMRDASEIVWTGSENGNWDLANTKNFLNGGSSDFFVSGDEVIFNDDAVSTNVNITENISPAAINVNSSKNFTFSGEGSIVAGAFVKEGTGTVTMNTENTYTGGNAIIGGTVAVSKLANSIDPTGNLGGFYTTSNPILITNDAVLKATAAVTNGSAIKVTGDLGSARGVIENSAKFTQQATISGDTIVKRGAGEFYMESGALSAKYIVVKQGTFTNNIAFAKPVRLEGTAKIAGNGFVTSSLIVPAKANVTSTLTSTNYQAYTGSLTGAGTITVTATNTVNRVRVTGNWSKFEGTVKVSGSVTFPFDNANGLPNATLDLGTGTSISNVAKIFAIGKLTGTGSLMHPYSNFQNGNAVSGSNTWKVGNSWETDGDFTYGGEVTDGGGANKSNFEKVGTCKMIASKAWTNSGTVKVTAGELHVNAGVTLGTGALTVAAGASLTGLGAVTNSSAKTKPMTNSSVTVNGTLQCGTNATSTTASFWNFGSHALTFGSTGTYIVGIGKCATSATSPGCTQIRGGASGSSITFKDGATIKVFLASTYAPTATEEKADSFFIFNDFEKVTMGNVNFDLPDLPEHYYWDTAQIEDGKLFVRYSPETGIRGVISTDEVSVEVINTAGVKVANYTSVFSDVKSRFARLSIPKGVYVLRIRNGKDGGAIRLRK